MNAPQGGPSSLNPGDYAARLIAAQGGGTRGFSKAGGGPLARGTKKSAKPAPHKAHVPQSKIALKGRVTQGNPPRISWSKKGQGFGFSLRSKAGSILG